MYDYKDLKTLIKSRTPIIVIETTDERRILDMLASTASALNLVLYRWSIAEGLNVGNNSFEENKENLEPTEVLRAIWNKKNSGLYVLLDFHPFMTDARNVRLIKEIAQQNDKTRQTIIFVSHKFDIPDELKIFTARFELRLPSDDEIVTLIRGISQRWMLASKGAPMVISDEMISLLLKILRGLSIQEIEQILCQNLTSQEITPDHINNIIKAKYDILNREGVLTLEQDTAHLYDVGGLTNLKHWLEQRKPVFLQEKTIPGFNIPKGILLLGIQGSGKSLAAKAVAGTWCVPLLRLDFGSLYDKYIGETERKTRESLRMADRMSPCVLWFDEIEKGISLDTTDGGTSRRILSTLLTWMSEKKSAVFLVATANDIQTLPPELLRKGRFDEIFFVDLPDAETRKEIFTIHLEKRGLDPSKFDFDKLLPASEGFSGSEIEQAIVSGLYSCIGDSGVLTSEILLNELRATKPLSVIMSEQIEALREWAKERTIIA